MFVYSKKIIRFTHKIQEIVGRVISKEIGLKIHGNRFYDRKGRCSYPIRVMIYNQKRELGYFDPSFYELGFHECLIHASEEKLTQLIRHELAHYMTFINHGEHVASHGIEFQKFCLQMGWKEAVSRATFCLEIEDHPLDLAESQIFRKIKKLMALASSSSPYEAEQAMLKAQDLMFKHNIESNALDGLDEEKFVLKRVIKQKKEDAKMSAISRILTTFFVMPVVHRGTDATYLEILGTSDNVEIAEYVAGFLLSELDKLWKQAQKQSGLKGAVAKNSFFRGISLGYCEKVESLKKSYYPEMNRSLLCIEKKLIEAKEMAYPRLITSTSRRRHCSKSASLGESLGRNMNIRSAIPPSTPFIGVK